MVSHRERLSENWQLTWCLPHQNVSLRTLKPTENNQVTPNPSQDRSNGGVTLPSACRVANGSSQTSAPSVGSPRLQSWEDVTPIMISLGLTIGESPLMLMATAALAASMAFMLPVATPPNAVVFGSGYVTIPQMSRIGLWLNLLGIVAIVILTYLWLPVAFATAG